MRDIYDDMLPPTRWQRFKQWLRSWRRQRCDACDGSFWVGSLLYVSGDAELCDECFDSMMRGDSEPYLGPWS